MSWANSGEGDYSLNVCLAMMALDTMIYFLLAAYLEAVLPTQHGSPRHPAFPLIFLREKCRRLCGASEASGASGGGGGETRAAGAAGAAEGDLRAREEAQIGAGVFIDDGLIELDI